MVVVALMMELVLRNLLMAMWCFSDCNFFFLQLFRSLDVPAAVVVVIVVAVILLQVQ